MISPDRWPCASNRRRKPSSKSSSLSLCERCAMTAWAVSNSLRSMIGANTPSARIHVSELLRTRFFLSLKEIRFQTLSPAYFPLIRSEEHTSELQSLMRISYAVFCLKKKNEHKTRKIKYLTPFTQTHIIY